MHAQGGSAGSPSSGTDLQQLYRDFEAYPFSNDADFRVSRRSADAADGQAGLPTVIAAIRGGQRTPKQIDEMIGRAQWFYFTRLKGVQIPWEDYADYQARPHAESRPAPADWSSLDNLVEARRMMAGPAAGGDDGMSFAMLCRLISEGRADEVPRSDIPEGLNEASPSPSTMPSRAKPWELPGQYAPDPGAYAPFSSQPYEPSHAARYQTPQGYAAISATAAGSPYTFDHMNRHLIDPQHASTPLFSLDPAQYLADTPMDDDSKPDVSEER